MSISILTDFLPIEVEIKGVRYPINWDFRTSILFEQLMLNNNISEKEKSDEALQLYYGYEIDTIKYINNNNINQFVEEMLLFYKCGKKIISTNEDSEKSENSSKNEIIYSFEHDDFYIYSAFMHDYHIDLQDIEGLHWWKFKALFNSLSSDCKFIKILEYRSIDLSEIQDKQQKNFYRKMKKLYALPQSLEENEKQALITEMLLKGEDPRELLRQ